MFNVLSRIWKFSSSTLLYNRKIWNDVFGGPIELPCKPNPPLYLYHYPETDAKLLDYSASDNDSDEDSKPTQTELVRYHSWQQHTYLLTSLWNKNSNINGVTRKPISK